VIAPVDLSGATRGSLAVALTWASALRRPESETELTVLHVLVDPEGQTSSEGHDAAADLHREATQVRAEAGSAARVQVRELLTASADPASEILRRADADAADLLVIGTGATAAGRDSAERRIGRVSAAVVRATPRPVLLVPPPVWRNQGAE
jgi:nucleotide-binding universal stress UspA family protein